MTLEQRDPVPQELAALMRVADTLMEQQQFRRAALEYRVLLHEPALLDNPAARYETWANLGAALLYEFLETAPHPKSDRLLDEAIKWLGKARSLLGGNTPFNTPPALGINLVRAYHQQFLRSGEARHLMAANLALDEIATDDHPLMAERLKSLRRMLIEAVRRKNH
ncbi:hypothetical protein O9Z70_10240 [Devosia sp. YIM 151766]|uniref:hypothetical protein n=1 Tax=Devosia sp. YIM 151766 TaxID=3017325 RepID=UPI00255CC4D2|nr:hypothetical protein [Devosia sp. YIM 151766]WIY51861.1 hypothetical protein O9Z70_10240 [Devosia sp. YIM 151766]